MEMRTNIGGMDISRTKKPLFLHSCDEKDLTFFVLFFFLFRKGDSLFISFGVRLMGSNFLCLNILNLWISKIEVLEAFSYWFNKIC